MTSKLVLEYSMFADIAVALTAFVVMYRNGYLAKFWALSAFLVLMAGSNVISVSLLFFRRDLGISKEGAWDFYAASNWISSGLEYALILLMIYGVFAHAMKPMKGLHSIGRIIFRWIAGVSVVVALGIATGPHLGGGAYLLTISAEIQEAISILTLCLLLFVCLAIKPLGLSFRSHIFGVSLGLGIFATGSLVESVWCTTVPPHNPYASLYAFTAVVSCAMLLTWGAYFAMPEPERKMILLPTTSPYFLWNRISEALGDEPGFVAVAGFKPDMLAAAEMTILIAANKRVRELETMEMEQVDPVLARMSQYQPLAMHQ